MFKKTAAILALATLLAYSAGVKFPYPQQKNYPGGTINVTSASAAGDLKAKFEAYMTAFYVEGNCGSTPCARIKFYDPAKPGDDAYTVSEGIGYAMLMTVYFSNSTKSYQNEFDKLWAYYKANRNNNGVMNWKIQGFDGASGQNGATDAEFDVALALAMARYQFDDTKYENDAKELIGKIWASEMDNSSGLHKPGDAWDGNKNPSYVAPAAFEIFKDLDNSANWSKALTANYNLLKANQNTTSGLPSGWSDAAGNPNVCTNNCGTTTASYDQDAVRAPWRWATAYAWFGHTDAKTLLEKLATWVSSKNASDVKGPIELGGTWGQNANSSYIGSLMNALMVSSTYQTKLAEYWSVVSSINEASYFNHSMQLLTGLLATGNMPNLKACASTAGCGTNMIIGGGDDKDYTSLSKFDWKGFTEGTVEENMGFGANLESWYILDDKAVFGASTVTNATFTYKNETDGCKEETGFRAVKEVDGEWIATIPSYTFVQGNNKYGPYVGIGLNAANNGTAYNLGGCTGGFSYKYKGQGHNFKVQTTTIPNTSGASYFKAVDVVATDWTERVIEFTDLAQPTWASASQKVPFKAEEISGFIWELKGGDATCPTGSSSANPDSSNYCANPTPATKPGLSANTGSLSVKDFRCLGKITLPTSRPNACSEGAVIQGPGSGSGPITPIISLQSKAGKAFAVRNGVNLQVSRNATVEVFSLNGKAMRKINLSSGAHSVSLSDMPKGLYIVMVKVDNQKQVLRVPVK